MPAYFEGKRKKVRYGRDLVEIRFGVKKKEAFAVFSADDGSLNFYKRAGVPKTGEQFEGKTATEVYTGIETDEYSSGFDVPWHFEEKYITSMKFVDEIQPISITNWFRGYIKLASIDLSKLNTSKITDMSYIFASCYGLTSIDLSGFDTSNVTDMSNMFSNCKKLSSIDVSGFDTSNVTNMTNMFNYCSALTSLDLSRFDMSNITSMRWMFDHCSKLQEVTLGDKFAWKDTDGYLPIPNASYIPNADGKWYALSDGKGYAPADIPSNKADTYYAYPPAKPSLTGQAELIIQRDTVPSVPDSPDPPSDSALLVCNASGVQPDTSLTYEFHITDPLGNSTQSYDCGNNNKFNCSEIAWSKAYCIVRDSSGNYSGYLKSNIIENKAV